MIEINPKDRRNLYWWWDPPLDSLPVEFCIESTFHGLKYLGLPKRHLMERVFWMLAFCMGFCIATFFILKVWEKYSASPIIVSFQPYQMPIDRVPFPAVTICNVNNVHRSFAEALMAKVRNLTEDGKIDLEAFANLYYLDSVCSTNSLSKTFNFTQERAVDKILVAKILKYINSSLLRDTNEFLKKVLAQVDRSCEDMIPLCYWGDEAQNCTELFQPIITDYGHCCTFNTLPLSLLLHEKNDRNHTSKKFDIFLPLRNESDAYADFEKWNNGVYVNTSNMLSPKNWILDKAGTLKFPRRQQSSGRTGGLTVLLDPDLDSYFCTNTDAFGFQLQVHLPLSFPKVADNGRPVTPASEVFMVVSPDITVANKDILDFPLDKRRCYASYEYPLQFYRFYTPSNCNTECVAKFTYSQCNCVRYYMPRDNSQQLCGALRFNCTEKVRKYILKRGLNKICPLCFPNCDEVYYNVETSTMPLRTDVNMWMQPEGQDAPWAGKNVSILHMYVGLDMVYPKVRNQLYGTTDLLSNTGGLLSLCLGFSGLSVLEIIYFLTLRAFCRRRRRKSLENVSHSVKNLVWQKGSGSSKSVDTPNGLASDFRNWTVGRGKSLEISPIYATQYSPKI